MSISLKMPRFGMTMEEGTISQWHKREGEQFAKGEVLCSIETEKVTSDFEAPGAGRLVRIVAAEGQVVPVGEPICVVEKAD